MKIKYICLLCVIIALFSKCKESRINEIHFLEGIWKIENEEQYEAWKIPGRYQLTGYSYKLLDGKEIVLETLSINEVEGEIIYNATVPDQNKGETVAFVLNSNIKDYLSFENNEHDFPKKIQYKKITENEILVSVLGENDEGFSYKIIKTVEETN